MIQIGFDEEKFRQIVREEIAVALSNQVKHQELPPLLTVTQMMEVLGIGRTKASELLNRPGFPVFREAGIKVPTHLLFDWIEQHTEWVDKNTTYFADKAIL